MSIDHRRQSDRNTFAAGPLERLSSRRRDSGWIQARMQAEDARFIPVWRSRHLLDSRPAAVAWERERAAPFIERAQTVIFLGEWAGHPYFALDLSTLEESEVPAEEGSESFADLRRNALMLGADEAAVLAHARGLLYWHRRHRYCGRCGSATESQEAGHVRVCLNPECGRKDFPRTDPAIITLVSDGKRCLLGRQARWPDKLYSTLAGFIEPGESAEDAVAREVAEESGIEVGAVHYHSSQPWPFPASLMLGYLAEARSLEVQRGDAELEHARWFTVEEMSRDLPRGELRLPPALSIAHRLIESWFDARSPTPLADLLAQAPGGR